MDFGAEDEVRLVPFEDDKPKDAKNDEVEAAWMVLCWRLNNPPDCFA